MKNGSIYLISLQFVKKETNFFFLESFELSKQERHNQTHHIGVLRQGTPLIDFKGLECYRTCMSHLHWKIFGTNSCTLKRSQCFGIRATIARSVLITTLKCISTWSFQSKLKIGPPDIS